ncbi:MarR family winged helix-turn-helix transcriptional regulator [Nocardia sp. NPDC052278]|uniref:MarR family winged helix-turn-helix transcriptional regulator n=1 Tax=unclassified Nocardia TaxID=2637762 RepID=UPI0036C646E5
MMTGIGILPDRRMGIGAGRHRYFEPGQTPFQPRLHGNPVGRKPLESHTDTAGGQPLQYQQLASAELEPMGISPYQWAALNYLDEQYGHSQRVAKLLGVDRTTMVALIDQLQTTGWVERRPLPMIAATTPSAPPRRGATCCRAARAS